MLGADGAKAEIILDALDWNLGEQIGHLNRKRELIANLRRSSSAPDIPMGLSRFYDLFAAFPEKVREAVREQLVLLELVVGHEGMPLLTDYLDRFTATDLVETTKALSERFYRLGADTSAGELENIVDAHLALYSTVANEFTALLLRPKTSHNATLIFDHITANMNPQQRDTFLRIVGLQVDAARPGWPEIAAGLLVLALVGFGGAIAIARLGLDKVVLGLIFTALSGIAGLAGLAAEMLLRGRPLAVFGFRKVSRHWLLIGIGGGVIAFVAKVIVIAVVVRLIGAGTNLQNIYATGGSGGIWSLVLAILFLAVPTPLGVEFVFRGIVANALLRYGAFTGIVGSALIFALMHGINFVFPAALIVGLFNAELFRRTGSVWPGVVLHITFNLPTVPVMVMAGIH